MGSIVDFLENKTVLVTGATGFLAKIFVEKILRVQPNVKKLYLLVRAASAESALQRFKSEAVETDLFKVLKEKYGSTVSLQSFLSEKVTPVAGDITSQNLGVQDDSLTQEMWRDVDVIVNAAASTNFYERYDVALALNTFGAKFVLDFAKKCLNIKLLLHVSTAYVSGEKSGLIPETPYYLGETLNGENGLDIEQEKMIINDKLKLLESDHNANDKRISLAMKNLGMQRANHYGWPNTYVFTKAMGEMILGHSKGDVPLVILRPTIITSTYKEPFAGWIEGIKGFDNLIIGYGKGKLTCLPGDPEAVYDVVPADMVVNAMIATIVAHANQISCETVIYHVGSSISNPLKSTELLKYVYTYFTRHPWIDKDGKPVTVGEIRMLKSMASFHRYVSLCYRLPLQVLKVINVLSWKAFDLKCKNLEFLIDSVLRVAKLYKPYLLSKSLPLMLSTLDRSYERFDDMNTEELRRTLNDQEDVFYFDPSIINWEDYFLHTHIPGVVNQAHK